MRNSLSWNYFKGRGKYPKVKRENVREILGYLMTSSGIFFSPPNGLFNGKGQRKGKLLQEETVRWLRETRRWKWTVEENKRQPQKAAAVGKAED